MSAELRAHDAVYQAIRRGRLSPVGARPCVDCGAPGEVYHHHLGYAAEHRLSVVALCSGCHNRRHGREAWKWTLGEAPEPRADGAVLLSVTVRLEDDTLRRLRALAGLNGVGYQTLLKAFIRQRLEEEERGKA